MKSTAIVFLVLMILLSFSGYGAETGMNTDTCRLFSFHSQIKYNPGEVLLFYENRNDVTRFAEVQINDNFKSPHSLSAGDYIILNLFGDSILAATVQRSVLNVNGSFSFTANTKDVEGYFVLATTGNRSLGNLFLPGEGLFFKIISDPVTHTHYLLELDADNRDILESCIPVCFSEKNVKESNTLFQGYNVLNSQPFDETKNVYIDIMVVYTPAAKAWGDTHGGGINNIIAVSMANTQLVLDNSETHTRIQLVYSSIVDYEETGNSQIDLWRLVASPDYNPFGMSVWGGFGIPGFMEEVHDMRNEFYADLCVLFSYTYDTGGLAQQLTNRRGQPKQAFSIVRVQQAAHSYTQAHEMGHNMGCHHHKDQTHRPGPTSWSNWSENQWSAGWRWQNDDGQYYCSIMTYESGHFFDDGINHTRVPFFSNPDVQHNGTAAGHPEDGDNVSTIRETRHIVSNYRVPGLAIVSTKHVTDVSLFSAVSGGNIVVCEDHPVFQRGLVWSTEPYPTLEQHTGMTTDVRGHGNFTTMINDLEHSTGYYVAAYALNEVGAAYGPQRFFQTPEPLLPDVATTLVRDVVYNAAKAGGNVTSIGNSPVYQRGLLWAKHPNPTITTHEGITIDGSGKGIFYSKMNDLSPGTQYYYRSYASNAAGTNYGLTQTFNTPIANIFPNPFSETIEIAFYNENQKDVTVFLRNVHGQTVKKWRVSHYGDVHMTLSLGHLKSGLYLLSIQSEQHFPVWPLIKIGF